MEKASTLAEKLLFAELVSQGDGEPDAGWKPLCLSRVPGKLLTYYLTSAELFPLQAWKKSQA